MLVQLINTFDELPKTAIIAIKNDLEKKVYLTYTKDFGSLLTRFVTKFKVSLGLVTGVDLHEQNRNLVTHRIFMRYYQDMYEAMGYTIINKHKYLEFTCRIELRKKVVVAVLVNTRNEKHVVGVFKTTFEAFAFKDQYYNTKVNPYMMPVFAVGHTTKFYLSITPKNPNEIFAYKVLNTEY